MSSDDIKRIQLEVGIGPQESAEYFPEYEEAQAGALRALFDLLESEDSLQYLPGLGEIWLTVAAENFAEVYRRVGELHGIIDKRLAEFLQERYHRERGLCAEFHIWEHAYMIERTKTNRK